MVRGQGVVHPRSAPLATHEPGIAKNFEMVGDGRLIQRQHRSEIADAYLTITSGQGFKNGEPVGVPERFEEGGMGGPIFFQRKGSAAPIHRHSSILPTKSNVVNIVSTEV